MLINILNWALGLQNQRTQGLVWSKFHICALFRFSSSEERPPQMSPFQSHDSFLWPGMEGLLPPQGVQGFTSEPHGIRMQYTEARASSDSSLGTRESREEFPGGTC